MKEYLKMDDVFKAEVNVEDNLVFTLKEERDRFCDTHLCNDVWAGFNGSSNAAEYAAHAINSHDELVKKLKTAELTLDEVEWVLSEAQKNGNYDFDDLLAEVVYAIKRIEEVEK